MRPMFDHEGLDVYQLLLKFIAWATELLDEVKERDSAKSREVRDHLDRASLSSLFNTAEGNGKRRGQARAKYFDDARASATECAACLDALVAKGLCVEGRVIEGKRMLARVVGMLFRLVEMFDSSGKSGAKGDRVQEAEPPDYGIGDGDSGEIAGGGKSEDEDEDEDEKEPSSV